MDTLTGGVGAGGATPDESQMPIKHERLSIHKLNTCVSDASIPTYLQLYIKLN